MSQLFSEDTVFISKQKEKEKVFKEIAGKLLERKLVTSEYINNLIEREKIIQLLCPYLRLIQVYQILLFLIQKANM